MKEILISLLKRLNIVPVPLLDTQSQFIRARAILEANRVGLFAVLEEVKEGLSVEEVAERLGFSWEGTDVFLRALKGIGYLKQRNGRYQNSALVKRWILDPKQGIPNFLKFQFHGWLRLEHLKETLITGQPVKDYHEAVTKSSMHQEIYTQAMREIARLFIPHFIKRVRLPQNAKRLLDIGGAHGDYSRALVRRFPGIKATVLDLAGPITTAQHILDTEGNPEGIELRVGDAGKDDLGTGWDVILLANVVHLLNRDQNQQLFRRIYNALVPGGVLLIVDQFMGLDRIKDSFTCLLSLNFFIVGGRCYPRKDMEEMLKKTGFNRVRMKPFPFLPTSLIEAWK